jgi:hypothetical protein
MITEKQLRSRARKVQEAEAKLYQAQTFRDAAIAQAVAEGRTQTEVAALVGLTKARIGKIVAEVNEEPKS